MKKSIRLFTTVMVCMAMALCVSCKKDNAEPGGGNTGGGGTQTVATVTTAEVTEITKTTAVCGGEVKSENGWAVTERGVCWGTEPNPTPSDNCTVDGEGVGKFTSEITGLEPGTKYYVRAYAKNAAGTGFGAERSFTTLENGGGGDGRFSVSSTTTVEFARGNLYYDGSAFRFEENQWSFADTWNASHVSHFFWS
ncbi:MAG: fibronectin type III domain-containing protein, partial [bacterium]|nr:fibronectin type III domain-containing protein [Candidatus Limimorpha caballi]